MDKYGRALNFIGRRLGYDRAAVVTNEAGYSTISMTCKCAIAHVNVIDAECDTRPMVYLTYASPKDALRHMLSKKVKRSLWVLKGPKPHDPKLKEYQPWLRVFKDEDTLESLCIETDIAEHGNVLQDA